MITAVFPGSFDPPTFGHLNVIERARAIFDELHVVIAVNRTKNYCFTEDERLEMMTNLVKQWDNVSVHLCDTLIVDYAERNNAQVLVRGIRNTADFSYEFDLTMMNKGLNPRIETVFFPTDPQFFLLKSSAIKELAYFGGDISTMVPPEVEKALKEKLKR